MERIRHIIEAFTNEHGLLSYLSFIPVALFSVRAGGKDHIEPDFLGDNAPYNMTEEIKRLGPRG